MRGRRRMISPMADIKEEKKQKVYHITVANLALDTKDAYESVSLLVLAVEIKNGEQLTIYLYNHRR